MRSPEAEKEAPFEVICDAGDEHIILKAFPTEDEAEAYKERIENGFLYAGRRPPDLFIRVRG